MSAILETLAREGYGGELTAKSEGRIECGSCGALSDASLFTFEQLRRMEGASDPDEMMAIAALRCPICNTGGALVLSYGPEVSENDAAILDRLPPPPPPPVEAHGAPSPVPPTPDAKEV